MSLIEDIVKSTRHYTLHSHTQWCDGHAPVSEMTASAQACGMKHYGISPHSPVPIASPCNMSARDMSAYFAETARLKELYRGRMEIHTSLEIDFLGFYWGPHSPYFQNLPLDYRIGSVHFIPAQGGEMVDIDGRYESFKAKMHQHFGDDIAYVVNTFFDQSEKMIELGGFDMIGHLDKVLHNASLHSPGIDSQPWVEERVKRLIEMSVAHNLVIEINTKAWHTAGRMFPDSKWWPLLKELGAVTAVNSDAHCPDLIDAGRAEAYEMLDALPFTTHSQTPPA